MAGGSKGSRSRTCKGVLRISHPCGNFPVKPAINSECLLTMLVTAGVESRREFMSLREG